MTTRGFGVATAANAALTLLHKQPDYELVLGPLLAALGNTVLSNEQEGGKWQLLSFCWLGGPTGGVRPRGRVLLLLCGPACDERRVWNGATINRRFV